MSSQSNRARHCHVCAPRIISVFLPTWPTDRLRRQDDTPSDRPLIIARRVDNHRVVTAPNEVALTLGLRVGMPVSKAHALVPDLLIEPANPQADAESLGRLGLWVLERVSPMVAVDPPGGLVIDSAGASSLTQA
ncbi:hypothetical protein [Falsirhodobacter deserti]|uniref:Y-family DNA polymerase n=1 Tax=Falsirhodobacter deserti TaxID=1365611 RepID=UPI000FE3C760|nr:hypothetical protein [Falsirhodobacter deserti]